MAPDGQVFIDTAGWVALVHRGDNLHRKTVEAYRDIGAFMRFSTDAVLIETCNAFSRADLRPLAISLMARVKESQTLGVLEIVHVGEQLIQEGWEFFVNRMDKDWSLTDCISFVVMKKKGISKAITSYHHFKQAGFETLL